MDTIGLNGRTARRLRVGLLCFTAIPDDPRVRRQGDQMMAEGIDVVGIGLPGHRSPDPAWPCLSSIAHVRALRFKGGDAKAEYKTSDTSEAHIGAPTQYKLHTIPRKSLLSFVNRIFTSLMNNIMRNVRRARRIGYLILTFVKPSHALKIYWHLDDKFETLYQIAITEKVDLWIANDWTTLPIALRLQHETGVPFGYDTHELAIDEYAQHLKWRLTTRPVIMGIERAGIERTAFVTCVSAGIARRLHEAYALPARPVVVRNMPQYDESPLRRTGDQIRVLYHGIVSPGRALEECIASVALWRPEFSFTIRGPATPDYLADLKRVAAEAGVVDRVTFAPPVAMTALVAEARGFDVGLFAIKGHSEQNEHVLPNKFFEYAMAGLALCVSDLPEMRALLQEHEMGTLIPKAEPKAIASAINHLDASMIDRCRANALRAARELNWEQEGQKMVSLVRDAIGPNRTQ